MEKKELLKELTKLSEIIDSAISFLNEDLKTPEPVETGSPNLFDAGPDYCMTLAESKMEVLKEPLRLYQVRQRFSVPDLKGNVCPKCHGTGFIKRNNSFVNETIWCECRVPIPIYDIRYLETSIKLVDLPHDMEIYVFGNNEFILPGAIKNKYTPDLYCKYDEVYYTSMEQAELHKEELEHAQGFNKVCE